MRDSKTALWGALIHTQNFHHIPIYHLLIFLLMMIFIIFFYFKMCKAIKDFNAIYTKNIK